MPAEHCIVTSITNSEIRVSVDDVVFHITNSEIRVSVNSVVFHIDRSAPCPNVRPASYAAKHGR